MPGAVDGYSSSIVYKLASLRYIFLYQVWLFTRPNFSRKFIQRADVLHTLCFPACLPEICAKCVEGQCRNFFLVYSAYMNFFSLNFPLHEFFWYFAPSPPPITFLMVRPLAHLITSSESQGRSVGSGKTAAKVFTENGQESSWDATLNEQVPRLIRMLFCDWAHKIILCAIRSQNLSG